MKILVNTRLLLSNKLEGIGWFSYETLKRITKQHPEHEFIFLFDRPFSDEFIFSDNITPVVGFPRAQHPYLWYLFFDWAVPYFINKYKADLFLSPDGWIPLRNTTVKIVDVIHDLNFEIYPNFVRESHLWYMRKYFPRFADRADRIATVSEYSKTDIHKLYGISNDKIDVVYNGSGDAYFPISEGEKHEVRAKYTDGKQYFLYVGSINKRKNLPGLFKAYDKFRHETEENTRLILIGNKMTWRGEIEDAYNAMEYKDDVGFTGWVDSAELNRILSSALALTYTSFFEGFGIPIVEAFNSGTPVITSNTTSMPEVAGDAAIIVNPQSVDAICDAMKKLAFEPDLRNELIRKGFERKSVFNWNSTAEKLWQTIEKTLYN